MPLKLPSFRARRDVYPPDLWTKCPSCDDDALQQAARQEPAGLPDVRPPFPPLGAPGSSTSLDARDLVGARRRAAVRRSPSGSWTSGRIPTGWWPPRPRPACAMRPCGGPAPSAGKPVAICVMDFGFMGGSMGAVVGEKVTRAASTPSRRESRSSS